MAINLQFKPEYDQAIAELSNASAELGAFLDTVKGDKPDQIHYITDVEITLIEREQAALSRYEVASKKIFGK